MEATDYLSVDDSMVNVDSGSINLSCCLSWEVTTDGGYEGAPNSTSTISVDKAISEPLERSSEQQSIPFALISTLPTDNHDCTKTSTCIGSNTLSTECNTSLHPLIPIPISAESASTSYILHSNSKNDPSTPQESRSNKHSPVEVGVCKQLYT